MTYTVSSAFAVFLR